jgi:hypothetical protein
MKAIFSICLAISFALTPGSPVLQQIDGNTDLTAVAGFSESLLCTSSFNGDVKTYELKDGYSSVGHSVWISRKSKRAKAKYFADRYFGQQVNDRYDNWRSGKEVILISSGAYATGWGITDIPVGTTVDNGRIVNRGYESKMDGLVIVYNTGGIAVSNIENGDLYLASLGGRVNIKNAYDRSKFLAWAEKENATVFQTHLLIYKNRLQFTKSTGKTARRRFLVLANNSSGELFHIIFYMKDREYTLYDAAQGILRHLHAKDMDVIAAVNLDTGGFDIMSTGEGVRDCDGAFITGSSNNRDEMTNLLAYEYE